MSHLPTGHNHRSAVVIDVRNGMTEKFQERVNRLLESVGGPHDTANNANIKTDILTMRGNVSSNGPGLVRGTPDQYQEPDQPAQEIDLKAWAADAGYDMLVVVTNPNA